ncbi:GLUG motif-containing protein [uncultured Ruminococcus sp.]|uniref:GLUG motif-containing protein n=1 Tax=uncultured Ruminococcus sp. TaxID=165186 RepID=UPI00266D7397|nr:GLUG motif-containing protein [uncultured Ruminococcus sp.]
MKKKLKRTIAALSAIAMLGTTATVLPEGMSFDFGTGITASAAGTEQQSTDEATVYQPAVETTDKYDIDDGGAKVYQIEKYSKCDKSDKPVTAYSNTDKTQVAEHIIENGFCVNCDYLQPAVMNSKGQYEIGNAGQLYWFANLTNENRFNNYLDAILTSDIVVNENVLNDDMVPNEGTYRQWTPIGDRYSYEGVFDGNNHTISGLYYNDSSYCKTLGFICTAEYSEIKNLGIVDSYFRGNTSTEYSGGICAENVSSRIVNCFSICTIEGYGDAGGICGILNGDYLINCYSLSSLKNAGYRSDKIYADGAGDVDNCYFNGGYSFAGKSKTNEEFENGTVAYLLAKGSDYYPGENSWGQNLDNDEPKQKYPSLGGAKVYEVKKYSKCDKSDTPVTAYSNTDKTQVAEHIIENGFCVNCDYLQPAVETTDKYDIDDDSMKENVYEISNAGQLYWFAGLVNGTLDGVKQNTLANAILTANITVNENLLDSLQYDEENNVSNGSDFITWTPIADWMGNRTTQYSGTFDGNNKTVSGLYFNGDSTCIGLFGSSESDGNIKNVGVVDSYFKGNDSVGGVCGNNAGTITNCYNAGNLTAIESSATIGGICGYNNGGTVTNCYNTGTVTATGSVASVGGVCGCSIELISNCYNIGTVTATGSDADISGICGYNFGPIKNCYYLADTEDENGGKTTAQFASGEVAYLLSQGCTVGEGEDAVTYSGSVWGQNLATENYPVLNGKTVYQVDSYEGCIGNPGNSTKVYSNTDAPIYVEHNYSSKGTCTICGAFKNGIGEHLDGYSLSLDGNIGVNFFMELDKSVIADENAYMKFRLPNGKTSVVLVGDAKQQTVGGTTYYVFSCEVAAKEMNETITAQIITSDKKGEIYEYSVADYIQYIRDNPTEFDEKTLSLVNAMAGYGDYAKAYFNNENLDANTEMDAVTADTLASFDKQISGDLPEGITYYGSSLLLESNTTMRHYFKVAEGTDVSALSFSGSKGNYYYIDIPNISAEKLGTIQNVTIGNCTISYSPMSYAYAVLSSKNTSESLKNLVKSLYLYEQAAEAYKN